MKAAATFIEQPGSTSGDVAMLFSLPFYVYIVFGVFLILFALAND